MPFVASIIGEGGSGGAIAIAAGNTVLMLEHAIYSVIPPEGCSAILWRDGKHAAEAAEALRLTAQNLLRLRVIEFDRVDPWPRGEAIAAFPLLAGKFARKHPNLGSFRRVNGAISYCPNCLFEQIPLLGGTAEFFGASSGIFQGEQRNCRGIRPFDQGNFVSSLAQVLLIEPRQLGYGVMASPARVASARSSAKPSRA